MFNIGGTMSASLTPSRYYGGNTAYIVPQPNYGGTRFLRPPPGIGAYGPGEYKYLVTFSSFFLLSASLKVVFITVKKCCRIVKSSIAPRYRYSTPKHLAPLYIR
jgi:hypothetical protein